MRYDETMFQTGIKSGHTRASDVFQYDRAKVEDLESKLRSVLTRWPVEGHGRFVSLFVELCTVAEVARLVNSEPSLTEDDLVGFLGHSWAFFNSFKHK